MSLIYKYKINLDKKQSKVLMEMIKNNLNLYRKIYKDNIENNNINYLELFRKYKNIECAKNLEYSIYKGCINNVIKNIMKKEKNILIPLIFEKEGIELYNNIISLKIHKSLQRKYNLKNIKILINNQNLIYKDNNIEMKKINKEDIIIDKVLIIPQNTNQFLITIKYIKKTILMEDSNIVAIDLGVSNLAACTNLKTENSILINGGPLKSMNRYINNKIAKLQIIEFKRIKSEYKKKGLNFDLDRSLVNTKQIKRLQKYRENYIKTYMQKSANKIIKYTIKNKADTIVIGFVRDIVQNNRYSENFIPVPIQELEKELLRQGKKNNIKIRKISESYTSGCSSLDLENINKDNYNKNRRVVRGLFKSNNGIYINSDINGSLNILRKFIDKKYLLKNNIKKNKPIPNIIKKSVIQGYIKNPKKINIV